MNEKLKYTLLLIMLVGFSIFELIYILIQLKAIWIQRTAPVRVFPKGAVKYTSLFSLVVGIVMIYTFVVSDSFIYNRTSSEAIEGMVLGGKAWHTAYIFGKFVGVLIIVGAFLSFFARYSINETEIITGNANRISSKKCMAAKNGNIVTVTYRAATSTIPIVLLKFDTDNKSGEKAYSIIKEHYPML